jgi:HTH-type transcriptional regulator/antitoxin HigA
MADTDAFVPRWASPPSETIREALHERGISVVEFAKAMDVSLAEVDAVLTDKDPISIRLARKLANFLGGTVAFWLARDGQYRDDLARLDADKWAKSLPTDQMASFGWIARPSTWRERIAASLVFFGVRDLNSWRETYGLIVERAKFRFPDSSGPDQAAVSAWLRQAEVLAEQVSRATWSPAKFEGAFREIRPLTRLRDPSSFLPVLVRLCAEAGVAVVLLRSPRGCPASGASRFVTPDTPQIILSARYLADDHLWFTFFHEAAHLILHDRASTHVDQLEAGRRNPDSAEEAEADEFAESVLIPPSYRGRIPKGRPSAREVVRLAREIGIAPGVLVGQLQHAGVLSFGTNLNRLKRRYKWVGTTLERA